MQNPNAEVLNAEDLNSRPDQSPSRWVINFLDRPLRREVPRRWKDVDGKERKGMLRSGIVTLDYPRQVAADFPDCLAIVEEKVKPERAKNNRAVYRDRWWHYAEKRPELYEAIAGMERILIAPRVSGTHLFHPFAPRLVFADRLVVFAMGEWSHFALLSCTLHDVWAHRPGSTTHETRNTYFPEQAFETFAFPDSLAGLVDIGEPYFEHRQRVMRDTGCGLTATYNRFHDRLDRAEDIRQLRDLHVGMDRAVALAYGWDDLDLSHGFHQTRQGERFTISEAARRTVLDRLLTLNHERHAAEVAAGLFDEKKPKSRRSRKGREKDAPANGSLF